MNNNQKHQFAFHMDGLARQLEHLTVGTSFSITDKQLVHRVISILRLAPGQTFIVFDKQIHAHVQLITSSKNKEVNVILEDVQKNKIIKPTIIFLLPLLKKDAFETALYSLVEVGVTQIQLVTTEKSQHRWQPKDQQRSEKIIIAAAEQSKNFAYPELLPVLTLSDAAHTTTNQKIFFDPAGITFSTCVKELQNQQNITLALGPEGDLTKQEKEMMHEAGFIFCALTPTILRSCQAAALSAGIIRSLIR